MSNKNSFLESGTASGIGAGTRPVLVEVPSNAFMDDGQVCEQGVRGGRDLILESNALSTKPVMHYQGIAYLCY